MIKGMCAAGPGGGLIAGYMSFLMKHHFSVHDFEEFIEVHPSTDGVYGIAKYASELLKKRNKSSNVQFFFYNHHFPKHKRFPGASAEGIITVQIALLRYTPSPTEGAFNMTSPTENTAFDQTRLDKIRALQDKGITIFPSSFDRQHTVLDIKTKYADITHDKSAERVSTAGRIYIVRNHGKTVFADLGDETGKIQLYIRKERSWG